MQNLGDRTVTIMGLEDGSVYRRHYDQMHFEDKETEQIGDNTEDVSADIRREYNMSNPSVVALSGTPISVTSGEGLSVQRTCEAADAWVPLQEPARDVTALILHTSARDALVPRFLTTTRDVAVPIVQTPAGDAPTPKSQTPARGVPIPISQVPVNHTPWKMSLVEVPILQPWSMPPEPNNSEAAPRI